MEIEPNSSAMFPLFDPPRPEINFDYPLEREFSASYVTGVFFVFTT
jgi:hypothetical protein